MLKNFMNKMTGVQPEGTCDDVYFAGHGCEAYCSESNGYHTEVRTYRDSVTHEICYQTSVWCKCAY